MSSEKKCCVPGCTRSQDSHAVLHQFPNPAMDMDRFKTWVFNIGGDILALSNEIIFKRRRVCHEHFEAKYCCRNNRISNIAVPNLNMPGLSTKFTSASIERRPLRTIENVTNILPSTSKDSTLYDESLSDENSIAEVIMSATSDATETDLTNENNTISNLAAYWTSATEEVQHDDAQAGSIHPALSDAADDAGSSEDVNIPEPPPPPQLNIHTAQMCRVCLALDVKMFDLRDTELKEMFQFTTGITFEENEGSTLGSLICWECAARLQAATTFISKALFSDSLLKELIKKGEQIQKEYFETVKKESDSLIPPKTLTVTKIVHIVEIEEQNNMTQLVQSGDGDEPALAENDETKEIIMYEIKEQVIEDNSEMDVEGDKDVTIETRIEDEPTCSYVQEQNRTKILKVCPRNSKLLLRGRTSLRSDLTSSQEDWNDLIRKTCKETFTILNTKQNIEIKSPIKRSKLALSHDHIYYLKGDSEDGNKKKK